MSTFGQIIQQQANQIKMLEPEEFNALEVWTLYDTFMIMNEVETLYPNANWVKQYANMANMNEIPFFNVRNRSVGEAYCNLDSSEKLPYPYHICAAGIYVSAPVVSMKKVGGTVPTPDNQCRYADIFFATELPRFSAFKLKVGVDEKYIAKTNMMPSGQGLAGWARVLDAAGNTLGGSVGNLQSGTPHKNNKGVFPEPIAVPRDRNMSGSLHIASYFSDAMEKAAGPGVWLNTTEADYPDQYAAASIIRVVLAGFREVQLRNQLHFD
jgi:hypothetical protein